MSQRKKDCDLTVNDVDTLDEINEENKKAFKKEREEFANLPFSERIKNTRSVYHDLKNNLPEVPSVELSHFSKLIEKKRVGHKGHTNIEIPWEKVRGKLNQKGIKRGNQIINSQVEAYISELAFYQPIFPTLNKARNGNTFRNRNIFDITNKILEPSGVFIKFFTVIKKDNVIVATVDLFEGLVWCSIVFSFEKTIVGENINTSDETLIFSQEDLDDDMNYAVYLGLNVVFVDYFFHLCPCFDFYALDRKE